VFLDFKVLLRPAGLPFHATGCDDSTVDAFKTAVLRYAATKDGDTERVLKNLYQAETEVGDKDSTVRCYRDADESYHTGSEQLG
jgi:hypothetical protein